MGDSKQRSVNNLTSDTGLQAVPVYVQMALLAAVAFLCLSCASHTKSMPAHPGPSGDFPKSHINIDPYRTENHLRKEYRLWRGTRHKMGGTDQLGVDCSGFVRAVYRNVFGIELPRTTKGQLRQGTPVSRADLQAGDLVFFRPPHYPRHVGIYLSNNEFIHASKTNGVTISRIDPYYWEKYYWKARRIHTNR
jgi:cell wall-associated NlpC family hydrolase